jgi:hypothetical protein
MLNYIMLINSTGQVYLNDVGHFNMPHHVWATFGQTLVQNDGKEMPIILREGL